jgi:hypothetical protein
VFFDRTRRIIAERLSGLSLLNLVAFYADRQSEQASVVALQPVEMGLDCTRDLP